jgi:hypothetical protein
MRLAFRTSLTTMVTNFGVTNYDSMSCAANSVTIAIVRSSLRGGVSQLQPGSQRGRYVNLTRSWIMSWVQVFHEPGRASRPLQDFRAQPARSRAVQPRPPTLWRASPRLRHLHRCLPLYCDLPNLASNLSHRTVIILSFCCTITVCATRGAGQGRVRQDDSIR